MNNDIINNINQLPNELQYLIKEFVPKKAFVLTNRENYKMYHSEINITKNNYDNYIRDVIKRDNDFVFKTLISEDYCKWFNIKNILYKNISFKNYLYFIINFCIENQSVNCQNILSIFLKEHGLCKNLHKKNIIKYII